MQLCPLWSIRRGHNILNSTGKRSYVRRINPANLPLPAVTLKAVPLMHSVPLGLDNYWLTGCWTLITDWGLFCWLASTSWYHSQVWWLPVAQHIRAPSWDQSIANILQKHGFMLKISAQKSMTKITDATHKHVQNIVGAQWHSMLEHDEDSSGIVVCVRTEQGRVGREVWQQTDKCMLQLIYNAVTPLLRYMMIVTVPPLSAVPLLMISSPYGPMMQLNNRCHL